MKLIKKLNKNQTFKSKAGKDYHPVNYYVVTDNGKYIMIKPSFKEGYAQLDMVAEYVK